jgi:hypothetical protein
MPTLLRRSPGSEIATSGEASCPLSPAGFCSTSDPRSEPPCWRGRRHAFIRRGACRSRAALVCYFLVLFFDIVNSVFIVVRPIRDPTLVIGWRHHTSGRRWPCKPPAFSARRSRYGESRPVPPRPIERDCIETGTQLGSTTRSRGGLLHPTCILSELIQDRVSRPPPTARAPQAVSDRLIRGVALAMQPRDPAPARPTSRRPRVPARSPVRPRPRRARQRRFSVRRWAPGS